MNKPRLVIAAPGSGSGKTLITCALLGALKDRGMKVRAFKCGPDYIDPMFHRTVQDIDTENLDLFFSTEEELRQQLFEASDNYDISITEGVMGLFDGIGAVSKKGSAYHIAAVTGTPIVLVVDVKGMGRSIVPLIKGFIEYDSEKLIKGVILNRISEGFYKTIRPVIEEETGAYVAGFFPERKELSIESRHLGLKLPNEIAEIKDKLSEAAAQLKRSVDIDGLIRLAEGAYDLPYIKKEAALDSIGSVTLALARDEAFCFYYDANIRLLEEYGVRIKYFSPIRDKAIPEDADGLLIGGGYPELYAAELSDNKSMLETIRKAIASGMPSIAECGGFIYLHDRLIYKGKSYDMVGAVKGEVSYKGKLVRFGYLDIREKQAKFLPEGKTVKGHEFHYFDSSDNGRCCTAVKPLTQRSWDCIHSSESRFWGFPHLYYPSAPEFVRHFADKMREYNMKAKRREK